VSIQVFPALKKPLFVDWDEMNSTEVCNDWLACKVAELKDMT
jgi:hypothetical protein